MARFWTTEEVAKLKEWYAGNVSIEYAARRLGRNVPAVQKKAERLGLSRYRTPTNGPQDVASRIAALLGERPREEGPRHAIPDASLLRYVGAAEWPTDAIQGLRDASARWVASVPSAFDIGTAFPKTLGLADFSRELCGVTLQPYQLAEAAAILASKRTIILAGRQTGKTALLCAMAVFSCIVNPNYRVFAAAGADRQAQSVMKRCISLLAATPELYDSVSRSNLEEVTFRNGSTLRVLPTEARIRGFSADLVLVDEGREILDEQSAYSAIEPALSTTDGSLAILSTPFRSSGRIWEAWHDALWTKVRVASEDSPLVSKSYLDRQRLSMSAAIYACEHECRFLETVSQYLDSKAIARAASSYLMKFAPEEGRVSSCGIDPAVTRDAAVWLVSSRGPDGRIRVDHIRAYHDVAIQDQKPYAVYLDSVYHLAYIVPERAGLGIDLAESLRRDYPDRCIPVTPTTEQKALVFENMKAIFERGEIDIPTDPPNLVAELRSLEFEVGKTGHLQIHAPGGMSDDYAHALAYSLWPFRAAAQSGVETGLANLLEEVCPECEGKEPRKNGCWTCEGRGKVTRLLGL